MEQELKALLGSLKDYLPRLIAACDTVAEEIKFGDKEKGYATLAAVFDGLSWVYDALGAVARAVPEEVAELNWPREAGYLGQLEQALVDRDDVMVADVIVYEVREAMVEAQTAVHMLYKRRSERQRSERQ
ncbi:hypothetical protein AB1399_07830 [Hydrogenibacillus schlegelii]|uniref:Uncharacterized protein n=1 Tax=Hydrogenibacillus schlegelii TaxID=1484 RepID=A0A179IU09_HYDSH|nr:hypothetical protein [Hydrogenibacillus schlegelii]OAR05161.1 hypothetical protein SA87_08410 [Hydrogenibacillus schlegelii]